jgi:hypothetical protein
MQNSPKIALLASDKQETQEALLLLSKKYRCVSPEEADFLVV